MKRRDFLKYQVAGGLWLAAGASGLIRPARALAAAYPDIAAVKGQPGAAARAAVELLGGMKRFVKPGDKVVIKPNMSFTVPPERASNTSPDLVAALAAMCKEADAGKILILDNPLGPAEQCLDASGIADACAKVEKDMVFMVTRDRLFEERDIPGGKLFTKAQVMKEVLNADVLIAAPQAKSHSGGGVSLTMKGMMGLISNRWDMHRVGLQTAIVDLASILKPALTVVDATRVLSTGGPGGPGKVIKGETVIASTDMVAADAYTVASFEWYGQKYKPTQVRHILEAHQRGLGRADIENLTIKNVSV